MLILTNYFKFNERRGKERKMEIIEIDIDKTKYPQRLLQIKSFPTKIYALGNTDLLNARHTIGIVGSRVQLSCCPKSCGTSGHNPD